MDSTIYRKIESHLMAIIQQNANLPNYKLPSERMLSVTFGASRKPVRHAYQNLIDKGYVVNIHGKGYFIGQKAKEDALIPSSWNSPKISLIIPSIVTQYSHDILSGASEFCNSHQMELAIHITDDKLDKESYLLRTVPLSDTKGIILFPGDNDNAYNAYNAELSKLSIRKYPLVLVDRMLSNVHASFISSENHQAMTDAVGFLRKKGFEHLVYMTPPSTLASTTDARINGFTHGMLRHYKMAKPQNLLTLDGSSLHMKNRVVSYLKEYPETQVVIVAGCMRMPVLTAAQELGMDIPGKLQLMIFDDELSPAEHQSLKPYILKQDGYQIGYLAAQALYNQIYGDLRPVIKKLPVFIVHTNE